MLTAGTVRCQCRGGRSYRAAISAAKARRFPADL